MVDVYGQNMARDEDEARRYVVILRRQVQLCFLLKNIEEKEKEEANNTRLNEQFDLLTEYTSPPHSAQHNNTKYT